MNTQAVLFDLDGVLVDACDWHYEALNSALAFAGYRTISREDHETKFNGLPTRVKLDMLGVPKSVAVGINANKQKHTLDIINANAHVMDEKVELLTHLRGTGVKIACVTNSIRETAEAMLSSTGQLPFIDLLVSNEDVAKNKPHPECYNYAIRKLNVNPFACLCVEDSQKGLHAAIASLVTHVWAVDNSTQVTLKNYRKFVGDEA